MQRMSESTLSFRYSTGIGNFVERADMLEQTALDGRTLPVALHCHLIPCTCCQNVSQNSPSSNIQLQLTHFPVDTLEFVTVQNQLPNDRHALISLAAARNPVPEWAEQCSKVSQQTLVSAMKMCALSEHNAVGS